MTQIARKSVKHGLPSDRLGVDPVTGIAYYTLRAHAASDGISAGTTTVNAKEPRNPNSVAIRQRLIQCAHDQPDKVQNWAFEKPHLM